MLETLFRRRKEYYYPQFLIGVVADMFAVVQYWEPPTVSGPERGRLFEKLFYRYCENRQICLTERSGCRTLCGHQPASGFLHESDAVLSMPNACIHIELKHLTTTLGKNDLIIFNQKGLDFLFANNESVRRCPLYRLIISANLLTPAARRFALQWGIIVVEPDRLPLLLLHQLSGSRVEGINNVGTDNQDQIWGEIPKLITPLQDRVRQLYQAIEGKRQVLSDVRVEQALNNFQRVVGDRYWNALDRLDPTWLEQRFDLLNRELNLDGFQ